MADHTATFLRVLSMRAEAFGAGQPVHDYERAVTYMPDGSVTPFLRVRSPGALNRARDDAAICAALEAALNDLPPTGAPDV